MDCLEELSRRQLGGCRLYAERLQVLRLLLSVVACEGDPPIGRLRSLCILPVADGRIVAASDVQVCDIPPELAASLGDVLPLSPQFSELVREEARLVFLLEQMGIESLGGAHFFQEVLLPRLTRDEPPTPAELVACTRALRHLLASCGEEEERHRMVRQLGAGAGWWALATEGGEGADPLPVRVGASPSPALHLRALPPLLGAAYRERGGRWLVPAPAYAEADEDWDGCWLQLGAWPGPRVAAARSEADGGGDWTSEELDGLLGALQRGGARRRRELAEELVRFLAPHGPFYARFLYRPAESELSRGPSAVGRALCRASWFPTAGGEIVPPTAGWLAPHLGETPELAAAEARFVFVDSCQEFADSWPELGIERSPSGPTLVAMLQGVTEERKRKRVVAHMAVMYAHLSRRRERMGTGVSSSLAPSASSVENFLAEGRWIFVPDHPRSDIFEAYLQVWNDPKRRVPGEFYRPQDVVFGDATYLLDSFASAVPDSTRDFVRRSMKKRAVANYYLGPMTVCSPVHQSQLSKYSDQVHKFLRSCGVQERPALDDYISVLRQIDSLDSRDRGKHRQVVPRVLEHLFSIVMAEQDLALGPGLPQPLLRVSGRLLRAAPSLRRFLEGTARLRCVETDWGSWEPLPRVLFTPRVAAESQSWLPEARRLVASPRVTVTSRRRWRQGDGTTRGARALQMCGLRDTCSGLIVQRAVGLPLSEAEAEAPADAARQLLELAVELSEAELRALGEAAGPGGEDLLDCVRAAVRAVAIVPMSSIQAGAVIAVGEELARAGALEPLSVEPAGAVEVLSPAPAPEGAERRVAVARVQAPQPAAACVRRAPSGTAVAAWGFAGGPREGLSAAEGLGEQALSQAIASSVVAERPSYASVRANLAGVLHGQLLESIAVASARGVPEDADVAPRAELARPGNWEEFLARFGSAEVLEALRETGDPALQRALEGGGGAPESGIDAEELLSSAWQALNPSMRRSGLAPASWSSQSLFLARQQADGPRDGAALEGTAAGAGEAARGDAAERARRAEALQHDGVRFESRSPFEAAAAHVEDISEPRAAAAGAPAAPGFEARASFESRLLGEGGASGAGAAQGARPRGVPAAALGELPRPVRMGVDGVFLQGLLPSGRGAQGVGELGERVAARALEDAGYKVLRINEPRELGLPFDLLAAPPGEEWPAELRQGRPLRRQQVAALLLRAPQSGVIFVEVKSSSASKAAFEVSLNEVIAMDKVGPRYWIARVTGLSTGSPRVELWKQLGQAVCDGRVQLYMEDPWG
ncbi:unnamed protein product [Prorocentrum cordatum]|uniref:Protein NO VEIN C-terminal domain-containing protein n=1 Tax=Prorocentrum cordatum TaxID=2364126 RepID=A0ABN9TA67_9DINO|nr:unnamed protein product [Polarella glacialis]